MAQSRQHYKEVLGAFTVLYIEDEVSIRRRVARFLRQYVDEVFESGNGREALALYETHQPDLIISDIQLPEMDGLEFAQQLRILNSDIPIILATAYSDKELLFRAIELNISHYLVKPLDFGNLLEELSQSVKTLRYKREVRAYQGVLDKHLMGLRIDRTGCIKWASEAFCKLAERACIQVVGSHMDEVGFVEPLRLHLRPLLRGLKQQGSYHTEVRFRLGGKSIWLETTVSAEYTRSGKIRSFTVIQHDITYQKQIETITHQQQSELRIARKKQLRQVLNDVDDDSRLTVRTLYRASEILSGDIYSLQRTPSGGVLIYLIDAMGHGLLPSFTAFSLASTVQRNVSRVETLEKLLERVVMALRVDLDDSEQLAFSFFYFNKDFTHVSYAIGGMYPAHIGCHNHEHEIKANNLPMTNYREAIKVDSMALRDFHAMTVFSDGLLEAQKHIEINPQRLLEGEYIDQVIRTLHAAPVEDDVTLIHCEFKER